ncbi:MAG TPA: HD domain-containing protein, partial [Mycobacteriales bacterium]|nr:HD domain-containing protein [Mycobacteriales bacterium]
MTPAAQRGLNGQPRTADPNEGASIAPGNLRRRRVRARLARRITAGTSPTGVKAVLEPLVATHRSVHPKADLKILQRAYDIAEQYHRGQLRKSGDPYITHPLAVATILAELGMDTTTLVA